MASPDRPPRRARGTAARGRRPVTDPAAGADAGSMITAVLEDGPLRGGTFDVEPVEGRPPKTIEVPDAEGGRYRYCLAQWAQRGSFAAYTFLYPL
jgi:hypothetical protein